MNTDHFERKIMNKLARAFVLAAAVAIPAAHADNARRTGAATVAQASEALSEGEVRKVDKDAKKITIKHGPLANLDMPAMTMVFQVKEPAMVEQVKAGEKVKFRAEKVGAAYVLTRIERAN
jgi:Cu/Ag efflux protein CusF